MTRTLTPPPGHPAPTASPDDRVRAVHARLAAAVADLTSGERWRQMLRTAAILPTYSPHNVLLITSQCPHARAVAGFHTWKQLGRAVRKGEKGIAILAPVPRRPPAAPTDAEPAASTTLSVAAGTDPTLAGGEPSPARSPQPVGFRVVHVFDISQTDGPDLPTPDTPVLLDGQAPTGLLDGLTAQVHDAGYQLIRHHFTIGHPGGGVPNGVTDFLARTVIVRPDLSDAQSVKTLAHELGHVLLHAPAVRPAELTRPQAEVEAESVAYVVAAAHGLDTSRYTLPYVAGWSGGDHALIARTAERVISTSHGILTRTPAPPTVTLPAARSRTREHPDRPAPDRARPRQPEGETRTDPTDAGRAR